MTSRRNLTPSPRELEILQLLWAGLTSPEIGRQLKISRRTVEVHRYNLSRKWGVTNVAQLLRYALQHRYLRA